MVILVTFLNIYGARMNILFIVEVEIQLVTDEPVEFKQ